MLGGSLDNLDEVDRIILQQSRLQRQINDYGSLP